MENQQVVQWENLKAFTDARIALGRTGVSIPSKESLSFKMAHANARDAVHEYLDNHLLIEQLSILNHPILEVRTQAINRLNYLLRPDLGRMLDQVSIEKIQGEIQEDSFDISLIIADGLSATAVHHHIVPLLQIIFPYIEKCGFTLAPLYIVQQGRVAISDEIGFYSRSSISIIFLGERPGLSSADSLGAYLTYKPAIGNTDAMRNCISNIREKGLSYQDAANKLIWLIKESMKLKMSGIAIKENNHLYF